ncbi:UDP-N-acetylmuramate dehydrogenase [Kushneria aurantia]|uniref:UDP-N-acetylenolpyruvoylglucosamine reductase n=1 Tax=Kushneria aurantia TaxID=504092 RepID=A0ABV6G6U7_9GAMM|nr:UDP-N-acetylmuramate dehydrogenase [Kushneria aurantia]
MRFEYDATLREHNTLGFDCRAEALAEPGDIAELRRVLSLGRHCFSSLTPLGGGSNVVLRERLPGLAVRYCGRRLWRQSPGSSEALWHVEAGVNWHELVVESCLEGWWGLENLALIPGSVGAAPIQNIGAYGVEVGELIEAVHVVHIDDGRYEILDRQACEFGYRDSLFKRRLAGRVVIVRVVLRLRRDGSPRTDYGDLAARLPRHPSSMEIACAVCALRGEKLPDPQRLGNAGSFFKNPIVSAAHAERLLAQWPTLPHWQTGSGVKLAAGWLIEACGWKGVRRGGIGVHQHQALVLVHYGGETAETLLAVADDIRRSVMARFDVELVAEPQLLGEAPNGFHQR